MLREAGEFLRQAAARLRPRRYVEPEEPEAPDPTQAEDQLLVQFVEHEWYRDGLQPFLLRQADDIDRALTTEVREPYMNRLRGRLEGIRTVLHKLESFQSDKE